MLPAYYFKDDKLCRYTGQKILNDHLVDTEAHKDIKHRMDGASWS